MCTKQVTHSVKLVNFWYLSGEYLKAFNFKLDNCTYTKIIYVEW